MDLCVVRAFVLLFGAILISLVSGVSYRVAKEDRCTVFAFTLAGTIGFACVLFGACMVPLLVQCTLFNTAPFWASILGFLFLRERLSKTEILALFLSFGGVICVAYSGSKGSGEQSEGDGAGEEETYSSGTFLLGCVFVLVCAWCEASVTLLSRRLQNLSFSVMLFWYGCVAVPCNLLIIFGESWLYE